MIWFFALLLAFGVSWLGVEIFRRWSVKHGLLDRPNERSSHTRPVPRGGGVVIVAASLLFFVIFSTIRPGFFSWGYLGGAVLIALISWLDDVYDISLLLRILVHFAAAVLVVLDLGYWSELYIPVISATTTFGFIGALFTVLWIVWTINAYNFMDGIDGLAGLQAVIAAAAWAFFGYYFGASGYWFYFAVLGSVCLGFLVHNWPPAKIFMGDVGSAFLGFTFATAPLIAAREQPQIAALLPVIGSLFIFFFLFDAVWSRFRRLLKTKYVWAAHREHIYQRLVTSGKSHETVTKLYGTFATIVASAAIFVLGFRGMSEVLLLLTIAGLTLFLVLYVRRKKSLT